MIRKWYSEHFGLSTDEYGSAFEWNVADSNGEKGFTQWQPFRESTEYFRPSSKEFMINYRVENMEALVEELKKEGVTILDEIETFEYGKFIYILNLENSKIELWEPIDKEFEKIATAMAK